MKKKGFTVQQHWELGRDLKAMGLRLNAAIVEMGKCYRLGAMHMKRAEQAVSSLENFRSAMDDLVFKEMAGMYRDAPRKVSGDMMGLYYSAANKPMEKTETDDSPETIRKS